MRAIRGFEEEPPIVVESENNTLDLLEEGTGPQQPVANPYSRSNYKKGRGNHAAPQNVPQSAAAAVASAENPYSRVHGAAAYSKEIKRGKRRKGCLIALLVVLLAALAVVVAGAAFLLKIEGNMNQDIDEQTKEILSTVDETVEPGDPFYMLLMGVDGSFERGAGEMNDNEGTRSDSLMLVRIDPKTTKVTMVSIHRDIMLTIPGYGTQKINAAHAFGGPAMAIETVSEFAGVDISHYAEINFDAFKALVDELGGVTVDVPIEINDYRAGGYVPAGEQTLNGEQALILCRSRHAYDAYGDGDTFRAANQRMVIGAIIEKILDADLGTMAKTIMTLSEYVVTDMSVSEIVNLAVSMKDLDVDKDLWSAMTPTTSLFIYETWYEQIIQPDWDIMMERVDAGEPPVAETIVHETGTIIANAGSDEDDSGEGEMADGATVSEPIDHSGHVAVRNGTSIAGAAGSAAEVVEGMGYTADAADANSSGYNTTVVVYNDKDDRAAAQEIAEELGKGLVLQNDGAYAFEGDFLVLIGWDWQS